MLGPEKNTCAALPYTRITEIYQDPRTRCRCTCAAHCCTTSTTRPYRKLVSFIDPANPGGPFPGIELRHLGGALNRPPSRPRAVSTQGAAFHLRLRMQASAERPEVARKATDEVLERLRRWDTGAMLPGFLFDHDSTPERGQPRLHRDRSPAAERAQGDIRPGPAVPYQPQHPAAASRRRPVRARSRASEGFAVGHRAAHGPQKLTNSGGRRPGRHSE